MVQLIPRISKGVIMAQHRFLGWQCVYLKVRERLREIKIMAA